MGSARGAGPTVAAGDVDPTTVLPSAPTEILDPDAVMPSPVGRWKSRTVAPVAVGSSVILILVAALLAWALAGGHRTTSHQKPTTTLHAQVTTTIPVPATPPTTAAPTPNHHKGTGDHGNGNRTGRNGGGDN